MNIANIYGKSAYMNSNASGMSQASRKQEHKGQLRSVYMNATSAKCLQPATIKSGKGTTGVSNRSAQTTGSIRDNLRALADNKQGNNKQQNTIANSVINDIRNYGSSIKNNRINSQSANNNMKKLKYHFKSIASKIVRSKTSSSARQVVGQAKREIIKLKREKQSGKYSSEEIDAAITHAKAMERIARKKVKHLEEEEMAKASGGPCADRAIDEEEIREREKEAYDKLNEAEEQDQMQQSAANELYGEESYLDEYALEDLEVLDPEMLEMYMDMSDSLDSMEVIMSDMEELTSEMMDEFAQSMQEMLEEMGLDELTDGAIASKGDMDPADLKAMKIKHRNKEMKEIVKADAEYLKAVFDQLEKAKAGGGAVPGSGSAISSDVNSAPVVAAVGGDGTAITTDSGNLTTSIDICL